MIKESDFNADQRELRRLMGEISEECYTVAWMHGLEYAVWSALQDGNRKYGMGEMDATKLERCRELSNELKGWIIWADIDIFPRLAPSEWGPRFIDLADWLSMIDHYDS